MPNQVATWSDETYSTNPKAGRELVTFKTVQRKDLYQSTVQKRPVFKEVVHIVIRTAGDTSTVLDIPATDVYKERYPEEWARWERTRENQIPGFPLENWPHLTDTQKAEFRAMNIFTVEQFANLPDSVGNKIMGFNDLRNKARVFIEAGKDAEMLGQVRAEMAAKDKELAELRQMIMDLQKPKPAARPHRRTRPHAKLKPEPEPLNAA